MIARGSYVYMWPKLNFTATVTPCTILDSPAHFRRSSSEVLIVTAPYCLLQPRRIAYHILQPVAIIRVMSSDFRWSHCKPLHLHSRPPGRRRVSPTSTPYRWAHRIYDNALEPISSTNLVEREVHHHNLEVRARPIDSMLSVCFDHSMEWP